VQELFNVNYFIVSQTNPHALPFLQRFQRKSISSEMRLQKEQPGVLNRHLPCCAALPNSCDASWQESTLQPCTNRILWNTRFYRTLESLMRSEMQHRCNQLIEVGLAPNFLHSLINQTYLGDVTIVAPVTLKSYQVLQTFPVCTVTP